MLPSSAGVEAILKDLVGFDTRTRTSNAGLIRYVDDYLRQHGVASRTFWAPDGLRGNLLATIGPTDGTSGIILSGHTDVVPADRENWDSDPFVAVVREGRLYGRGTADMKGFVASVLAAVPALVAMPLALPMHLVLTFDEEIDCAGMRELLATPEVVRLEPQAVILGEPTNMGIVIGHRGHQHLETLVRGRQAHGGNAWQGRNAIAISGGLIAYLHGRHSGSKAEDPASAARSDSINIGTISGGEQFNIVAGSCRFDWEVRTALGAEDRAIVDDFERHCREIEAYHATRGAEVRIETTLLETYPEFHEDPGSPAVALVRSITGLNDLSFVGYGTEAPFYQQRGFPIVIFGPGSIDQAHQPNEYVEVAQLHSCTAFVTALGNRLSS